MTEPISALERELVDLGRALVVDAPPVDLERAVLTRVTTPVPLRAGRRRRLLVAALVAALGLSFVPPVRAAVLELLRIGGIEIGRVPTPSVTTTSRPSGEGLASLEEARRLVAFPVRTSGSLGPPDRVELLEDGRVVAQSWGSGPTALHLDALDGTLDWGYLKSVWSAVQPVEVGGRDGAWLGATHVVQWVDRSGATRSSPPRLSGPTLVWTVVDMGGRQVTYRLEGAADLATALEVASFVR